jgi:hypothetical protein
MSTVIDEPYRGCRIIVSGTAGTFQGEAIDHAGNSLGRTMRCSTGAKAYELVKAIVDGRKGARR